MKELKNLKDTLQEYNDIKGRFEDAETLIDMAEEEGDDSLIAEIGETIESFKAGFEDLRIATLLSGEYDNNNAIVTIHAGAGGTEA